MLALSPAFQQDQEDNCIVLQVLFSLGIEGRESSCCIRIEVTVVLD